VFRNCFVKPKGQTKYVDRGCLQSTNVREGTRKAITNWNEVEIDVVKRSSTKANGEKTIA